MSLYSGAAKSQIASPEIISGTFPLSFAQESLWIEEQISPGSAYSMPEAWRLIGPLNQRALRRALEAIVERHETLRTVFREEQDGPRQVVRERGVCPLRQVVITPGGPSLQQTIAEECRMPFDLEKGPLVRALLCRISEQDHVLVVNMHHIISDAWSQALFARELADFYSTATGDENRLIPELPIQFADFAVWQRETFAGPHLQKSLAYWTDRLAAAPPPISPLPDYPRAFDARAHEGCTRFYTLDPDLVRDLGEFCRARHVTLFATLLAAFKVLLHRHTLETDLVVGCPIAGRERVEAERLIGLFVNTHALRTDLGGDPVFSRVLESVRERALEAMAHQDIPLSRIVDEVRPARSGAGNPLFHVVFGLQTEPAEVIEMTGLEVRRLELDNGAAKFDWTVLLTRTGNGISIRSEHRAHLYDEGTIARLISQYTRLLRAVLENPERPISEYDLVLPEERRLMLDVWNRTEAPYDRNSTVHDCFSAKAAWHPDRIALVFGERGMTYGELETRSNEIARALQKAGLLPGQRVIVGIDRSPDLIAGLLGILKAGGVYVPLDRCYPPERQAAICQGSNAVLLLSDGEAPVQSAGCKVLDVTSVPPGDGIPEVRPANRRSEDAAYVMFTSGSTGTPKGVVVNHRAILRLVQNTNYVRIQGDDVFLQFAPAAFDASTFEIWGALLNGARLVIAPPELPSLSELGKIIQAHRVSILWLTAGLFNQIVDNVPWSLAGVKQILTGGEALSVAHIVKAMRALPGTTLINGYGPTENTTFSCCYRIPRGWRERASVPIGGPIGNSYACVLDPNQRLCPVGMPGELYVWGDGLALGYAGREDLTQERFVTVTLEPKSHSQRMYRTGDLARWLPDGTIEFLSRADRQIKMRGYRIEPGEIEVVLAGHPGIHEALVTAVERPSGKQLAAYVVPSGKEPVTSSDLTQYALARLPAYMVPGAFVLLEQMPLTSNGKVDRPRLPEPVFESELEGDQIPPRTEAEQKVARVWEEVLKRNGFDVRQDFFQLGGHSLLATQAASRLSQVFGVEVPVIALFEHRTIEALANALPRVSAQADESQKITRYLPAECARELLNRLEDLPEEEVERLLKEFGELK